MSSEHRFGLPAPSNGVLSEFPASLYYVLFILLYQYRTPFNNNDERKWKIHLPFHAQWMIFIGSYLGLVITLYSEYIEGTGRMLTFSLLLHRNADIFWNVNFITNHAAVEKRVAVYSNIVVKSGIYNSHMPTVEVDNLRHDL